MQALVADPTDASTVFAATAGGIFASMDRGVSWTSSSRGPLCGVWPPGSGIAFDPTRPLTLYAACGNGVWKSVDGGRRWVLPRQWPRSAAVPVTVVVAPSSPQTLYGFHPGGWSGLSTIWRSGDGGRSWVVRSTKSGPQGTTLAVDARSAGTLYLGTGFHGTDQGLFRSVDGGRTWQRRLTARVVTILADPAAGGVVYAGGYGGVYASPDGDRGWRQVGRLPGGGKVTALALDPETHALWAGTSAESTMRGWTGTAAVYRSTDGGRSWTRIAAALGRQVTSIAAGQVTLVSSDLGVWKQTAGRLEPTNAGLVATTVTALTADPVNPGAAYTSVGPRIYATADGAASWQAVSRLPVDGAEALQLAVDPKHPATVYAAALIYPGPRSGLVLKSTDRARSWRIVKRGIHAMAVAVDPSRPNVVYAGAAEGVFTSTDGGATWRRPSLPRALREMRVVELAVDPQHPRTVYAGTYTYKKKALGAVYRSTDGAASWQELDGLPSSAVHAVTVDPHRPDTVYTVMVAGVFRSDDRGRSWRRLKDGPGELAPDPKRSGVLYVGHAGGGVFVTTDRGRHWRAANTGIPSRAVTSLAVSAAGTTLLAGTSGHGVAVAPLPLGPPSLARTGS